MRISTLSLQQQAVTAILDQQSNLARTQLQVATGRRILSPSDDPIGATQVQALEQSVAEIAQYRTNANLAINRLSLEESTLGGVNDVLQRIRELTIQANNDTQTAETRSLIATEVKELGDQLLALANTQNGQGEYLFSGFRTGTQPFSRSAGTVLYKGDQGQRFLQIGIDKQIPDGDPGTEIFQFIPTGNGTFTTTAAGGNTGTGVIATGALVNPTSFVPDNYTIQFVTATDYEIRDSSASLIASGTYAEGESIGFQGAQVNISGAPAAGDSFGVNPSINVPIFSTIDQLVASLDQYTDTDAGRAQLHTSLNNAINGLDQGIGRVLDVRTSVGSRLSAVDAQLGVNDALEIQFRGTISDIQDLDYAEAIGRLNLQLTGLQAAQQAFSRVQNLSLFNFL